MVIINRDNFESEVLKSEGFVLVDFFADWCGPCKMLAPVLNEIAEENEGTVKVLKVNVDSSPEIAGHFGIQSIPTLILFKDGEPVKSSVGFVSKEQIEAMWK